MPDLARPIEAEAALVDTLDLLPEFVVASGTGRKSAGIGKAGSMLVDASKNGRFRRLGRDLTGGERLSVRFRAVLR
jgi:hypothetical protein